MAGTVIVGQSFRKKKMAEQITVDICRGVYHIYQVLSNRLTSRRRKGLGRNKIHKDCAEFLVVFKAYQRVHACRMCFLMQRRRRTKKQAKLWILFVPRP